MSKAPFWKRKGMDKYHFRNAILRSLGYSEPVYKNYLKSAEWREIRSAVMAKWPSCVMCERPAEVIHHMQYDIGTLLGLHYTKLAPLCNKCHELVEFEKEEKNDLQAARMKVERAAKVHAYGQSWFEACLREWSDKCQQNQLNNRIIGMEREIRELLNAANPEKITSRKYSHLAGVVQ